MAGLVDVALQAVTDKQEALVRSKAAPSACQVALCTSGQVVNLSSKNALK